MAANAPTWPRSGAHEISTGSASSATTIRAGRSSLACRKACSAKLTVRAREPLRRRASRGRSAPRRRGRRAARRSTPRRRPRTGRGARPTSARARRSRSGRRSRARAARSTQRGEGGQPRGPHAARASDARARQERLAHVRTMPSCARRRPRRAAHRPRSARVARSPGRAQRARRPAAALRHRPGDRLLPGRALQQRPGGPGLAHGLRRRLGRFPARAARPRQRPLHPRARVRLSRSAAGRPVVRRRRPVAAGLPGRGGGGRRPGRDQRPGAGGGADRGAARSTPSTSRTTPAAWNEPPAGALRRAWKDPVPPTPRKLAAGPCRGPPVAAGDPRHHPARRADHARRADRRHARRWSSTSPAGAASPRSTPRSRRCRRSTPTAGFTVLGVPVQPVHRPGAGHRRGDRRVLLGDLRRDLPDDREGRGQRPGRAPALPAAHRRPGRERARPATSSGTSRSSCSVRDGEVVARFRPRTLPDAPEVRAAIESLLGDGTAG